MMKVYNSLLPVSKSPHPLASLVPTVSLKMLNKLPGCAESILQARLSFAHRILGVHYADGRFSDFQVRFFRPQQHFATKAKTVGCQVDFFNGGAIEQTETALRIRRILLAKSIGLHIAEAIKNTPDGGYFISFDHKSTADSQVQVFGFRFIYQPQDVACKMLPVGVYQL